MSNSEILAEIERLNGYISRLENLLYSTYDLDFTQFKTAGTENWSGKVKSSKFDKQYKSGSGQLAMAAPEIEEAISVCRNKIFSLALSLVTT